MRLREEWQPFWRDFEGRTRGPCDHPTDELEMLFGQLQPPGSDSETVDRLRRLGLTVEEVEAGNFARVLPPGARGIGLTWERWGLRFVLPIWAGRRVVGLLATDLTGRSAIVGSLGPLLGRQAWRRSFKGGSGGVAIVATSAPSFARWATKAPDRAIFGVISPSAVRRSLGAVLATFDHVVIREDVGAEAITEKVSQAIGRTNPVSVRREGGGGR